MERWGVKDRFIDVLVEVEKLNFLIKENRATGEGLRGEEAGNQIALLMDKGVFDRRPIVYIYFSICALMAALRRGVRCL